jgi:hypothetical protein
MNQIVRAVLKIPAPPVFSDEELSADLFDAMFHLR